MSATRGMRNRSGYLLSDFEQDQRFPIWVDEGSTSSPLGRFADMRLAEEWVDGADLRIVDTRPDTETPELVTIGDIEVFLRAYATPSGVIRTGLGNLAQDLWDWIQNDFDMRGLD